jgi:membrane protein DedA with SNARE-associated domain
VVPSAVPPPQPPPWPAPPSPATAEAEPAPIDRRLLTVLLAAYTVLVVAANVGSILAPSLVNDQPTLLLALSARMRHLLLTVAANIDAFAYWAVGGARLAVAGAVCFLLGRHFGERGLSWIERQTNGELPATFVWLERAVDRAGAPLVVLMPASNVVAALVGVRRMSPTRFAVLLGIGIAIRLGTFWFLGITFEDPLDRVLDWIERYQWWLVGAFLVLSVLTSFQRSSRTPRVPRPPQL